MTKRTTWILAGLGLVLGIAMGYETTISLQALEKNRVRAAELESIAQQERAKARVWQTIADNAESRAAALAQQAGKRDTVTMVKYRVFRDSVVIPDTCKAIVAVLDSTIVALDSSVTEFQGAYLEEKTATEAMRSQVLGLETAYDSLHTAYTLLAKPPRPSLLARLKPDMRPGLFAGLCTSGTPCAGVGLTLSWRF